MFKQLLYITVLILSFSISSAYAQQPFPISGEFNFVKGTKYSKASDGPSVILQNSDANFVIHSKTGGYLWGLSQHDPTTIGKVASVKFTSGNLEAFDQKGSIWKALTTPDATNKLVLNWRGALQIVSEDQSDILWSSDGNLAPDEGPIPAIQAANALEPDAPLPGTSIYTLLENCAKCQTGLDLLKTNMYKYPANPTESSNGRRPWSEVFPEFKNDYLPGCQAVGTFINVNKGKKVVAAIEASYAEFGLTKWEDYFDSWAGIEVHGSRIPQYCPGLHRSQFDCIEASRRMLQISIPGVEKVLGILSSLECMPQDGYSHCRVAGQANIHVYGTDKVSVSAMKNIDHVYTTMTDLLKIRYPVSNFEGYKVYVTNEETIAELDALAPINRMWKTGKGEGTRDELRGGTNNNFLWITEQMICKTGVVTRNRDAVKDNHVRTFDQVVHEFGHAIDMRFDINSAALDMYKTLPSPVEGFAAGTQTWFGTPDGNFRAGELTLMSGIFTAREGFTCDTYKPE